MQTVTGHRSALAFSRQGTPTRRTIFETTNAIALFLKIWPFSRNVSPKAPKMESMLRVYLQNLAEWEFEPCK